MGRDQSQFLNFLYELTTLVPQLKWAIQFFVITQQDLNYQLPLTVSRLQKATASALFIFCTFIFNSGNTNEDSLPLLKMDFLFYLTVYRPLLCTGSLGFSILSHSCVCVFMYKHLLLLYLLGFHCSSLLWVKEPVSQVPPIMSWSLSPV